METHVPRIWCSCGHIILAEVGDGFVVTAERKQVWMRRRFDSFTCPGCETRYNLQQLRDLLPAPGGRASSA